MELALGAPLALLLCPHTLPAWLLGAAVHAASIVTPRVQRALENPKCSCRHCRNKVQGLGCKSVHKSGMET